MNFHHDFAERGGIYDRKIIKKNNKSYTDTSCGSYELINNSYDSPIKTINNYLKIDRGFIEPLYKKIS